MIIIFIELCRIADSLLWIPKSSRRTSKSTLSSNVIRILAGNTPVQSPLSTGEITNAGSKKSGHGFYHPGQTSKDKHLFG
ncbi:XXYS1_4_G0037110.mRNA.1.CDS.1 [Saccharomyces cerevisiae]|nr:XXYS1_4_G0037110.mRNA.1.CDS.1 [Saccharomyces cerevisiae]